MAGVGQRGGRDKEGRGGERRGDRNGRRCGEGRKDGENIEGCGRELRGQQGKELTGGAAES